MAVGCLLEGTFGVTLSSVLGVTLGCVLGVVADWTTAWTPGLDHGMDQGLVHGCGPARLRTCTAEELHGLEVGCGSHGCALGVVADWTTAAHWPWWRTGPRRGTGHKRRDHGRADGPRMRWTTVGHTEWSRTGPRKSTRRQVGLDRDTHTERSRTRPRKAHGEE